MWIRTHRLAVVAIAPLLAALVAAPTALASTELPAPISTIPVTGAATVPPWDPDPPTLVGVRTGRHADYDRTVFDFTGGAPGYRVEYGQLVGIGTGTPIPVAGAATLLVVFDGGYPALDLSRIYDPALPTLRQIRSGGAFEGRISFGLGVNDRVGFRVLRLTNPPRIAVDVAHQPTAPFGTETFWGGDGTAPLVGILGVRSGAHPGYDRIVLDLATADTPLISVAYTRPNPTTVHVGLTAATTQIGYAPGPVHIGLTQIRGVSFAVYENGTVSAFITTDHRTGFRVMLLDNPTRIAIDVKH